MYIIIAGCGRIGSILAQDLAQEGHDVAVIDRNIKNLNELGSGFNGIRIKGIEFDRDKLEEAGIQNADYLMAITPSDSINITVSLIAQKIYHVPRIIVRDSALNMKKIYDRLHIDTVSPTMLGVDMLKQAVDLQ